VIVAMLRTPTVVPSQQPVVLLLIMLMVNHCSAQYADRSSLSDEFARWIASRIAQERDTEV